MTDDGWTPKHALFPKMWRYYDLIVTGIAGLLTVLNAALPITHGKMALWISAAISLGAANLVWLRHRAKSLGVLEHGDHTGTDTAIKGALEQSKEADPPDAAPA